MDNNNLQMLTGGGGLLLRRRMMMQNQVLWVNPYITNGLIAMWDGEWNAGGGKHTTDTEQFVNLATGARCPTTNDFVIDNNAAGSNDINNTNRIYFTDVNLYGITTITYEIILKATQYRTVNNGSIVGASTNNKFEAYPYGINATPNWQSKKGGTTAIQLNQRFYANGDITHYAFIADSSQVIMYQNGSKLVTKANTKAINYASDDFPFIALAGFSGRLYCGRIYNRALTDDEIATNYAIDVNRFLSPDV